MKRAPIVIALSAVFLITAGSFGAAADTRDADGAQAGVQKARWTRPVPLFDRLEPEEDIIYLLSNSSFVWGPDPHGLSEEITFTGFVTVPKWPLTGYDRRTLPDGRQQIDIELSDSELKGASYVLGGWVHLGEHPDLKSLGTITESHAGALDLAARSGEAQIALASTGAGLSAAPLVFTAAGGVGEVASFRVNRELARVLQANQDILWSDLVSAELNKLDRSMPLAEIRLAYPTATLFDPVDVQLQLPAGVLNRFAGAGVDVNAVVTSVLERIVTELELPHQNVMTLVVPADFIVARKVLLNTAKGILYNETAVPVRGQLDAIPPVRHKEDAVGLNVFRGMELPIPLLDEDKNVDGWFYSKVHLAMSVRPYAIEKETVEATLVLQAGEKRETIRLTGPAEIHHGSTRADGKGLRETDLEVVVLALRGRSQIFGSDIMVTEAFSDREKFSRGKITWRDGQPVPSNLDLFVELLTPAGKLVNQDPIQLAGTVGEFTSLGTLEKGNLRIPLVHASGSRPFVSTSHEVTLFNEADRGVAKVLSLDLRLTEPQVARNETVASQPSP